MLKPVRLSAKCYDKHFAIFIMGLSLLIMKQVSHKGEMSHAK